MVRIRLARHGSKKNPHYRIVVADQRFSRDGRFIEQIGYYNPRVEPSTIKVDGDRATYWMGQGAQPTNTVSKLFKIEGVGA